jgi:tetratricopeptide (TPR) repeat protein
MEGKAIAGREIALTGRMATMTREEAVRHLERCGARHVANPTETTDYLVVGQAGWPLQTDGALTSKLVRFREIKAAGADIQLLQESDFLQALGLEQELEDITRLYTSSQVSRVIEEPPRRIRSWVRHGLLKPARVRGRLAWFEFRDVVLARAISELSAKGVRPSEIRRSIAQLSDWLPDAGRMIGRLEAFAKSLQVRLGDGRLADPNGQLHFDFRRTRSSPEPCESNPASASPRITVWQAETESVSTHDWLEAGLEAEEEGRLQQAIHAYRKALDTSEQAPEVLFNLGNVLYDLGNEVEAAQSYLRAIEIDREFAEAWNNLGNALSAMGKLEDAVKAYRTALSVEPEYADAHCNLADTLEQLGRPAEAYTHRVVCSRSFPAKPRLRLVVARPGEDE